MNEMTYFTFFSYPQKETSQQLLEIYVHLVNCSVKIIIQMRHSIVILTSINQGHKNVLSFQLFYFKCNFTFLRLEKARHVNIYM